MPALRLVHEQRRAGPSTIRNSAAAGFGCLYDWSAAGYLGTTVQLPWFILSL
jgi:hypothetical protein